MISDIFLESLLAIGTHHEPYFERPETSGQGDLPIAIVDDLTRIRGCIAQIRRMDGECVDQLFSFLDKKATTIVSLFPSEDLNQSWIPGLVSYHASRLTRSHFDSAVLKLLNAPKDFVRS